MKVFLKIPARIQSVDYPAGSHEMPDENADDWFLKALAKDGNAVIEEQPKDEQPKAKRGPKPKAKDEPVGESVDGEQQDAE